jgi:putative membrane protein
MLTPRGKQRVMRLLVGSLLLRPYVFLFLLVFLAAGVRDLGARRTALFLAWVWPLAFVAEFASTRIGIPFGLYHYTATTHGQELFIADVPFFDSLSFTFLAYASFSLARTLDSRAPGLTPARSVRLALLSGLFMMLLDVVIDPLAVRGDRWFLGRIFWYPDGGPYFGVPLSNFAGWLVVGAAGVGGYLLLAGRAAIGHKPWVGVALYYAVLVFNLVVTAWIREWLLLAAGVAVHVILGASLLLTSQRLSRA